MSSSLYLSLHVETKTQSPVVGVGCLPPSSYHASRGRLAARLVLRFVPRSASRSVLLACLIWSCGSHRLIISSARLSLGGLLPPHRLIGSPPAPYRPAPRPIRQAGRGGNGSAAVIDEDGGWRRLRMANGWRRAAYLFLGWRRMADGGWRMAGVAVAACLFPGWRWDGSARVFLFPSHRLIKSTRATATTHHLIDEEGPSFSFRPTPSRLLFSACLLWLVPPSPAGGCAGLCHGLRRRACGLLACVLISRFALSLSLVRSLLYDLCQSCRSFLTGVLWGVLWVILPAILSGVGVPQNMPLNGILWLLTGIFGDGVRSYFSALPVASFSPICHALRPLSAAVSWRSCGRFPAVSWRKRRVCVLSCLGSFSASHVMGRMASRTGCRAGWMAPAGRLACLYRFALPLPLGAGDYVRSAVIGSACGEGVGDIVEVLLSISSSSFHLFIAVVIVSPCLLRCLRRLILVSPCLLRHPVLVVSSSPRCHRLCLAACVRSCPLCSRMGFLSLLSPFLRLAGRGVLCLLAHALWLSFPSPCSLVSCLPAFACHRGSPPRRLVSCGCSSCLSSRRVSSVPSCSSCLPVLRQAWAGSVSARCCLLAFVLVVRAAAGVGGIASAGLVCCLFASDGGRAMRCCRLWLCRVCVVVVCIYKLNACSCIMDIVERKRTRKDFDDE